MPEEARGFETRQIHAGGAPDSTTGAWATPAVGRGTPNRARLSAGLETIDILADLDAGLRAAKS